MQVVSPANWPAPGFRLRFQRVQRVQQARADALAEQVGIDMQQADLSLAREDGYADHGAAGERKQAVTGWRHDPAGHGVRRLVGQPAVEDELVVPVVLGAGRTIDCRSSAHDAAASFGLASRM